jgi:hypothetical protein
MFDMVSNIPVTTSIAYIGMLVEKGKDFNYSHNDIGDGIGKITFIDDHMKTVDVKWINGLTYNYSIGHGKLDLFVSKNNDESRPFKSGDFVKAIGIFNANGVHIVESQYYEVLNTNNVGPDQRITLKGCSPEWLPANYFKKVDTYQHSAIKKWDIVVYIGDDWKGCDHFLKVGYAYTVDTSSSPSSITIGQRTYHSDHFVKIWNAVDTESSINSPNKNKSNESDYDTDTRGQAVKVSRPITIIRQGERCQGHITKG